MKCLSITPLRRYSSALGASMVSFDQCHGNSGRSCSFSGSFSDGGSCSGNSDSEDFDTELESEQDGSSGTDDAPEAEKLNDWDDWMGVNGQDGFTFGIADDMCQGRFDGGEEDNDVHMWLDETFEF